jgi:hypothetical protein
LTFLSTTGQVDVTVNSFDGIPDNTTINTFYSGLTFTNPIGGNIYARQGGGFAPSQSNVVSVFSSNTSALDFYDAYYGAVDVMLSTPLRSASIDARPVSPVECLGPLTPRPYLQVLAADGSYLGPNVYYAGALPTGCCCRHGWLPHPLVGFGARTRLPRAIRESTLAIVLDGFGGGCDRHGLDNLKAGLSADGPRRSVLSHSTPA